MTVGLLSAAPGMAENADGLAPGDRVDVKVFDQPDLSGAYLVESNGELTLPLLGEIDASGMTPKGLQAELTNRLSNGYLQNPVVSVRLAELRPVTVVGDVRAAGRYPFIDGMTVETAVALAGGGLQLAAEEAAQSSELLRVEERVRTLVLAEKVQRVRKARIEAELKDLPTFEVTDPEPRDAEMLKRCKEGEQAVLDADRTATANQLALLDQQRQMIDGDIQSFSEQVALEKRQVDILDGEIGDLTGLLNKGMTRKSPVQDIDRERTRTQSNLVRVLGELAKAKSASAEIKLKIDEIHSATRNRLATELQTVAAQLQETEISLPLVREDLRIKSERAPFMADLGRPQDVQVSRYVKGRVELLQATLATPVRAGDIVRVGHGTGIGIPATAPVGTPGPATTVPDASPPGPRDVGVDRLTRR